MTGYILPPRMKARISRKIDGLASVREKLEQLRWDLVVRNQELEILAQRNKVAIEQPVRGR